MPIKSPVLLYGAGREARSTRAWLAQEEPDTKVFVFDDSGQSTIENAEAIDQSTLERMIAENELATIVKSPGVSLYKPVFKKAREAGVDITSNVSLWGQTLPRDAQVIAITGTKGKSTTATLLYLMLKSAGLDVVLGGNVGVPPLDLGNGHAVYVVELSSYQTADITLTPNLVGLTNLYPEHLDWHGSTTQYYTDKLNLLSVNPKSQLVVGPQAAANPLVIDAIGGHERILPALDDTLDNLLTDTASGSRLKGQHNIDNARLAARLALAVGANADSVIAGIKAFTPLPHRLAEHKIGKHVFVDDSISTTPEATKAALNAYFGDQIALIAGGFDRGQDYSELAKIIGRQNLALVICLPETGARLFDALKTHAPHITALSAETIDEAVTKLSLRKNAFDVAILSPGAPSYNQFKNFEERGDVFIATASAQFDTGN